MNHDSHDPVQQENRKAMKPYLRLLLLSLIGGGLLGFVSAMAADHVDLSQNASIMPFLKTVLPYSITAFSLIFLAAASLLYRQAKNLFSVWDGEDEASMERAERKLGIALWLTSTLMICIFFSFAAAIQTLDYAQEGALIQLIVILVSFFTFLALIVILQQKIVDLTKRMNPEKRGSVYDMNFSRKWEESCDEAQKLMIYKAGYAAFQATNNFCIALWLLLFIASIFFNLGLLPIGIVSLIWLVSTSAYSLAAIRLDAKAISSSIKI